MSIPGKLKAAMPAALSPPPNLPPLLTGSTTDSLSNLSKRGVLVNQAFLRDWELVFASVHMGMSFA